jgi:ABC-2 type transport system ATP-binding protein
MQQMQEQSRGVAARDVPLAARPAPAIELIDVTKRFGAFTAVDRLSLRVDPGEIFGLLGPNGSGKTTTVNMLSGLSRPSSGRVQVLGYDITQQTRAVRAVLGAVPQETALYEELTAQANMVFHAELYGVPRQERDQRIRALLTLVQLADRRSSRVGTFSGGMKRRLALARALLHDPQLVYLDEPTLGVDVQSRRALWDYILALKGQGKTVLITTNYLEEANALCDRLAIIDHGKLIALDTPANLKRRFGDTVIVMETADRVSPALLERLLTLPGVREATQQDGVLRVTMGGEQQVTGQVVTLVTQETALRTITQREPDLNEVFLSLTGSALRD